MGICSHKYVGRGLTRASRSTGGGYAAVELQGEMMAGLAGEAAVVCRRRQPAPPARRGRSYGTARRRGVGCTVTPPQMSHFETGRCSEVPGEVVKERLVGDLARRLR